MLKNKEITEGEIYFGKYAGKEIFDSIKKAKDSIKIITPYISGEYVDLLSSKENEGVKIKLVVSSDIGGQTERLSTLYKLIKQNRHVDEKLKEKRDKWLRYVYFSIPIILLIISVGIAFKIYSVLFLAILFPIIYLVYKFLKNIAIFSYSYSPRIPLSITMSPFTNGFDPDFTLTHAKLYIIDDVAYVGSLNFTKSAFWYNYESRVKLTNKDLINDLEKEFEYVYNHPNFSYLDISHTGAHIYKEPPN